MADDTTAARGTHQASQAAGQANSHLLMPQDSGALFPVQLAQTEGANSLLPVGNVTVLEGTARATHANNTVVDLSLGDPVFEGDIVETGPNSNLAITFIDNSVVTLSENARIVIEVLIYNPSDNDNLLTMSLLQGSFLLYSGEIAEDGKMLAKTPIGLLDITGTGVFSDIGAPGGPTTIVLVQDGLFTLIGTQDTAVFDLLGEAIEALSAAEQFETTIADIEALAEANPGLFAAAQLALSLVQQNTNPPGEGLEDINPEAGGNADQPPPVLGPQRTPELDPTTFDSPGSGGQIPGGQQSPPVPGPLLENSESADGTETTSSSTAVRLLAVLQSLAAFFPEPDPAAETESEVTAETASETEAEAGAEAAAAIIALASAGSAQEDAGATILSLFFGGGGAGGITVSGITNGAIGTVQILDAAAGIVSYTPTSGASDFLGLGETFVDSFSFTLTDSNGATVTQTFQVTVQGVNDPPTATPATGTAQEDGAPATIDLAASVADLDQNDVLTLTAGPGSNGGTTSVTGTVVTFTPAPGFYDFLAQGQTAQETFIYSATDLQGAVASAQGTVTIIGVNDPPVANDDADAVTELMVSDDGTDNFVNGNVLANDTDPDSSPLTVSAVSGGVVGGATAGVFGTLTLAVSGGYTYELNDANAAVDALDDGESLVDVFTYTAFDGGLSDTATLAITINGANDPPVANDDVNAVTELMVSDDGTDNFVNGNVLANDTDVDVEPLTVSAISGGVVGGATAGAFGTLTIAAAGSYTYELNDANNAVDALDDGESLVDVFTYTASDGDKSDTAVLAITINGANDPPVANADAEAVTELMVSDDGTDNFVNGNVLANDTDVDVEPLTVSAISGGVVGGDTDGAFGTLTLAASGDYTYELDDANADVDALDDGESLVDVFTYTAFDGDKSDTAILAITINGANDPPVANADADDVTELMVSDDGTDNFVNGNVLANDTDVDVEPLTVSAISGGVVGGDTDGAFGTLTLAASGDYTYELDDANADVDALDDGESLVDVFTYTAFDGDKSDIAKLAITINGANDAPVANADADDVIELMVSDDGTDNFVIGNVLANDTDVDVEPLTVSAISGGVVGGDTDGAFGTITIAATGGYTYELDDSNIDVDALNDGETLIDTFTYTATDGDKSDTATLSVTINGANDPADPQPMKVVWVPDTNDSIPTFDPVDLEGYNLGIELPTDVDTATADMTFEVTAVPDAGVGSLTYLDDVLGTFEPVKVDLVLSAAEIQTVRFTALDDGQGTDSLGLKNEFTYEVLEEGVFAGATQTIAIETVVPRVSSVQRQVSNGRSPLNSGNEFEVFFDNQAFQGEPFGDASEFVIFLQTDHDDPSGDNELEVDLTIDLAGEGRGDADPDDFGGNNPQQFIDPGDAVFRVVNFSTRIANSDAKVTNGSDLLPGLQGDDIIVAGPGASLLFGWLGADRLTGDSGGDRGRDIFVLREGDGGATTAEADIVTDYTDGEDFVGLIDLSFADLTIDQTQNVAGGADNDTVISITATGENLAVLEDVEPILDLRDFVEIGNNRGEISPFWFDTGDRTDRSGTLDPNGPNIVHGIFIPSDSVQRLDLPSETFPNPDPQNLSDFLSSAGGIDQGDLWEFDFDDDAGGTDQGRFASAEIIESGTGGAIDGIIVDGTDAKPDLIFGSNGDDVLLGQGENDTILGGDGNDSLDGGSGDDSLDGGGGEDSIAGAAGSDMVTGGPGQDNIQIADVLFGVDSVLDFDNDGENDGTNDTLDLTGTGARTPDITFDPSPSGDPQTIEVAISGVPTDIAILDTNGGTSSVGTGTTDDILVNP